eukprot:g2046.t1
MSARQRRRLLLLQQQQQQQRERNDANDEDDGDDESDDDVEQVRTTVGNMFGGLADTSEDEDEDTDGGDVMDSSVEQETDVQRLKSVQNLSDAKKKKKKKKTKKNRTRKAKSKSRTVSEDIDKILCDTSVTSSTKTQTEGNSKGTSIDTPSSGIGHLLRVSRQHLREENEIRRKFGRIKQNHRPSAGRDRHRRRRLQRNRTLLVSADPQWPAPPTLLSGGLGMQLEDGSKISIGRRFRFERSPEYVLVEQQFELCVQSLHDPNALAQLVQRHPFHCAGLLHLSDMMRRLGRMEDAAKLLSRCVYVLQCAFHPLFDVTAVPRVSYHVPENRALFECLFRHALFVHRRGCPRTALELAKLLLGLDSESDPMGALLCIDSLAVCARENEWLLALSNALPRRLASSLPGFAFARALALRALERIPAANEALEQALAMYPFALKPLIERAELVQGSGTRASQWGKVAQHAFWNASAPPLAGRLAAIVAEMQHDLWAANSEWLLRSATSVLESDVSTRGTETWRNVRAIMEASFSPGSAAERYARRTPYDYSERGGQLQGALDDVGPRVDAVAGGGSFGDTARDTREPIALDAGTNPLMLFFRTLAPWNRVEIPAGAPVSPTDAAAAADDEEAAEEDASTLSDDIDGDI